MHFFIFIFLLHTLINIYLFVKGWKALPPKRAPRVMYGILFFIVYSSFTLAMLGRNQFPLYIQKPVYMLGTYWLGYMLYLTLYYLITDLIGFINKYVSFLPKRWTGKPTGRRIQVLSGFLFTSVLLSYGYYHFTHPAITEQEIHIPKDGNKYKELKAVGISDLHLGITVGKNRLEKYVELINAQTPDIILIAGDLIDNNLYPLNKDRMWEELNQLKAPVFLCLGNHEYLSGIRESLAFLEKTSFRILTDESALVDESFYIIGRDDLHGKNRADLADLIQDLDKSRPVILLDHEPFHLEEAEENQIDLQFSGHTHYGQMFPLSLITKKVFELPYGYKRKGHTQYYVSSGLGLWGPQFRIGTKSEIVVFNIKFN